MMEIKIQLNNFSCDEAIYPHLAQVFSGEYEIPFQMWGAKILDIGANHGAFSIWAAHRFPFSMIYAYEPHPTTYKSLLKNVESFKNIFPKNVGVGVAGLRPLYNGRNNSGEATLFQSCGGAGLTGQHVEVIDPKLLPPADILKMDTEGAEIEILEPLLQDSREFKAILFEYHEISHRRILDALLRDYVLVGANVYSPGRGTCKYLHRSLVQ